MNLYKTLGVNDDEESEVRWSGSLADASKDRVAMKKAGLKAVASEPVDVPTAKAGLLEFLNSELA